MSDSKSQMVNKSIIVLSGIFFFLLLHFIIQRMLKTQECAACDLGLIHNLEYARDLGLIHNLEYTHQTPLFKKRDIGAIALKLFLHDKKICCNWSTSVVLRKKNHLGFSDYIMFSYLSKSAFSNYFKCWIYQLDAQYRGVNFCCCQKKKPTLAFLTTPCSYLSKSVLSSHALY